MGITSMQLKGRNESKSKKAAADNSKATNSKFLESTRKPTECIVACERLSLLCNVNSRGKLENPWLFSTHGLELNV